MVRLHSSGSWAAGCLPRPSHAPCHEWRAMEGREGHRRGEGHGGMQGQNSSRHQAIQGFMVSAHVREKAGLGLEKQPCACAGVGTAPGVPSGGGSRPSRAPCCPSAQAPQPGMGARGLEGALRDIWDAGFWAVRAGFEMPAVDRLHLPGRARFRDPGTPSCSPDPASAPGHRVRHEASLWFLITKEEREKPARSEGSQAPRKVPSKHAPASRPGPRGP